MNSVFAPLRLCKSQVIMWLLLLWLCSITKLNISCNEIGAIGSEKLSFALRKNNVLLGNRVMNQYHLILILLA